MKKILVDTSVWIEYFKGNKMVQDIIHDTKSFKIFLIGPVIAELLLGIKTISEKDRLAICMNILPRIEITDNDWIDAGNTGNLLRQKGITVPLTDLIIFSAAQNNSCSIFTLDKHLIIIKNTTGLKIDIINI